MCTLSFVPTECAYRLAMNRDESLTRERALPPEESGFGDVSAIYPRERLGGTWIAVNNVGLAFALLNRNHDGLGEKAQSRGTIIPELCVSADLGGVIAALKQMNLRGIHSFTLVCISGHERRVIEFIWDGTALGQREFPWEMRHWYS